MRPTQAILVTVRHRKSSAIDCINFASNWAQKLLLDDFDNWKDWDTLTFDVQLLESFRLMSDNLL